ncbi:MAG: hypothetical protein KKA62_06060 [Nanoarchaeota archaeon]|nr:hypothetical protein [Nanoarchaeota archaeon]MBU1644074.1 hypothetical protein [Nanoarchaeota archaeon]MBU1977489.1 hypothetical protein [Nanoarchaeota archaeon]
MVEFGTGYRMPMDREYGHTEIAHHRDEATPNNKSTNDIGVGIKDIGFSLGLGPVPNVPAIGAKLRAGSKTAELTFMGAGKGSGQQQTPEYYGKMQRQALSELRKANEVNFTTHASVGIQGLAGMDQSGNFSKANKNFSVQEIKRAIDFAADVAAGGPVVLHTGEFQRPIVDANWNRKGDYAGKFRMFEGEEEAASYRVVDNRSGAVMQEARKSRKVAKPVWNTAETGKEYYDGGVKKVAKGEYDERGRIIYLDYDNKRINDERRVPKYNPEEGKFEVTQMGWEDLEKEAKQMTMRAKEEYKEWINAGRPDIEKLPEGHKLKEKFKESYWVRFFNNEVKENEIEVKPEEAYIISTLETNAATSRGYAIYYSGNFQGMIDQKRQIQEALEKAKDANEAEKMQLRNAMKEVDRQISYARESSASQWAQAKEAEETIRHVQSAETYALKESYDAYAQAGMHAWEQTRKLGKKAEKPIAIAMENLFPESYGAHPDEIINLVENSRKAMARKLMERGKISEEEARKTASKHIVATIDTGHMNMWKKYWVGDNKKTIEQNDEDFKKWMVGKMGEMAKKGIVGHIHLVDNYGYQDDHLAPGEGNAPVREMIKVLKENGYKGEMIFEPGADWTTDVSGFHGVMKTWRYFGSPVYGAGSGPGISGKSWGNVGYSHFGSNQPPYFVFGGYSPSEEWTLWSGVPLE